MKPVSNKFKEAIKKYGRQIDAIITYTDKDGEHLLDSDVLFSITPTVNGNILKSVMKQLDFESSIKVPKGTIIKAQLGVQIDLSLTVAEINAMLVERLNSTSVNLLSAGLKGFEYITFGNYIISEEPEYNADTLSYHHKCYDKILYSMKKYEKLPITYPISIRDYIKKICSCLGLTFKNGTDTFANYNKQIKLDLYDGYDYTFRDILDELAQVTASTICINENTDELEIRYLNNTQDSINEDYLKDVNVEFGEIYGPINSIVLSRAGESDNVYLINEESIKANGLCELKIVDNQIMNDKDRSDYLPDILAKLNGVSYCINDFSSYGITWHDLCDMYTVEIGQEKYNCVLLNDEIKITQGLEETIFTEMPTVSETDYTKADKTDRRINKAYIIVDKQNQKIESLVSQHSETESKLTQVKQTVDGISQRVEHMADVTNTARGVRTITLENCVAGPLLELHIFGNNNVFKHLYPSDDLLVSDDLIIYGDSRITVTNNGETKVYELGVTDVLRQNEEVYDEYILKDGQAKVIRRVSEDGTTLTEEAIEELGEYSIPLENGTNVIEILNYTASMEAKFAIQNDYTEIFATKVEMNSSITQTAEEINLEVRKKVDENEIISSINQSAEKIAIKAEKIDINGTVSANGNFKVDTEGNMECKNGKFTGGKIELGHDTGYGNFTVGNPKNYQEDFTRINTGEIELYNKDTDRQVMLDPLNNQIYIANNGNTTYIHDNCITVYNDWTNYTKMTGTEVTAQKITQTSLAEQKKNFEKLQDNAIDIIKNIDIYKYNLKSESDTDKKHIGFVIGEDYNYSEEVTSLDNKGVDNYSFISLCCKAIQEQQEIIEQLQKEIKELKEGK